MRRIGRRLLLASVTIVFGLAVALALTEAAIRLFDPLGISYFRHIWKYKHEALRPSDVPDLYFEHVPGISIDVGVPLRIDSLGLRGPEIAAQKPAGTKRVLFLGDSIAFGWGVREEETTEALLARSLAERGVAPVEVLNGGVVMFNIVQERTLFETRYAALAPDLVVLVICGNDFLGAHPEANPEQEAGPLPDELRGLVSPLDWWLVTNSWNFATVDLLRHVTTQRLLKEMSERGDDPLSKKRREVMRSFVQARSALLQKGENLAALAAIVKRCRALGAPLVVLPFGAPADIRDACAKLDVPYVAGADPVAADPALLISPVDSHPNPAGHRAMEQALLATLERIGFAPAR